MAPAGRQGHPKVTIGTPKGDIVDHNRTTPSMEEDNDLMKFHSSVSFLGGRPARIISSTGLLC